MWSVWLWMYEETKKCAFLERSWGGWCYLAMFAKNCREDIFSQHWYNALFSSLPAVIVVMEFSSGCSPSSFTNAIFQSVFCSTHDTTGAVGKPLLVVTNKGHVVFRCKIYYNFIYLKYKGKKWTEVWRSAASVSPVWISVPHIWHRKR